MYYTLREVLAEVNKIRFYEFSLPPLEKLPKGKQQCANLCVIGRCFPGYMTEGDYLYDRDLKIRYELPEIIRFFICDFDQGLWPSLIEKDVLDIDSADVCNSQTASPVGA